MVYCLGGPPPCTLSVAVLRGQCGDTGHLPDLLGTLRGAEGLAPYRLLDGLPGWAVSSVRLLALSTFFL